MKDQTNRVRDAYHIIKRISVQLIFWYLDLFQKFSKELYHCKVEKTLLEV